MKMAIISTFVPYSTALQRLYLPHRKKDEAICVVYF